ncbi:Pkinase-domain-containing protein [Mycena belliarum]|uniref:non-specific serine/threonine protein kinase n=1 Tax=Mycena belliarum TaxID=1033014 RepID=A0AAD6TYD6_9AGAR|nr:Pkinase-domain-containing protein [Mycena belliae]
MPSKAYDVAEIPPSRASKPKRTNRVLGDYTLSKTLGAGSMGKVKLATHNVTGEKLAIKILPRARAPSQASKEAGKEIRTLREAGLSLLLHHPYICGMREMIVHPNHYYMVFEYVNGGQLLDFIIAHGRLRERVARKFGRQIASALDYCHRNNVVHRDLKIENILISQTGNIKIIDFGLSNLYDPASHLSTFCGSLYFAAPELLNAKLYTGPEVDIWSFGVVLYTLLCGKVPFEDESMPALHAKIKRGLVEYPDWLSAECKHLLSRMLVINPVRRALLSEIMSHPWMIRGFSAAPSSHLPARVPLRPADIDPAVVARMAGFDFGEDVEEVLEKLQVILESDEYAAAVLAHAHRANGHATPEPAPTPPSSPVDASKRRRFSGLDFYRRLFIAAPSTTPTPSTAPPPSPRDPTNGFHPLVSMYFLAREKLEREQVYGVGVFASSQVSVAGVEPTTEAREMHNGMDSGDGGQQDEEPHPVKDETTAPPSSLPSPLVVPMPTKLADSTSSARLTIDGVADGASDSGGVAVYIASSDKMDVGAAPSSPTPWPTNAEAAPLPQVTPEPALVVVDPVPELPSAVATSSSEPPKAPVENVPPPPPTVTGEPLSAIEETKQEIVPVPAERLRGRERGQSISGGGTLLRKFGSIFIGGRQDGRGTSRQRETSKRVSILGAAVLRAPTPKEKVAPGEHERPEEKQDKPEEKPPVEDAATSPIVTTYTPVPAAVASDSSSPSTPNRVFGSVRRRAATILEPDARAAGHERRSSTGAPFGGTTGRRRRASSMAHERAYESATLPKGDRTVPMSVPEGDMLERPDEVSDSEGARDGHADVDHDRLASDNDPKPVFLKGLLSVATTSTKPPPIIKADIRRVLDRMQVRYWQNKSGFECVHSPSIYMSPVDPPSTQTSYTQLMFPSSGETKIAPPPRTGITKRVSRLSFSVRRVKSQDREFVKARDVVTPTRPMSTLIMPTSNGQPFALPKDTAPTDTSLPLASQRASPLSINSKLLPRMSSDLVASPAPTSLSHDPLDTGEMDREAFKAMAHNALGVRFEINIVKVPLLPLHGIQFRRAGGDGWQYQMLARRVLTELKL